MRQSDDAEFSAAVDEFADPGRKHLAKLTDDELAELIANEPSSKQGHLAASLLRTRDAWRSPAKYALWISGASLVVGLVALIRTF